MATKYILTCMCFGSKYTETFQLKCVDVDEEEVKYS